MLRRIYVIVATLIIYSFTCQIFKNVGNNLQSNSQTVPFGRVKTPVNLAPSYMVFIEKEDNFKLFNLASMTVLYVK